MIELQNQTRIEVYKVNRKTCNWPFSPTHPVMQMGVSHRVPFHPVTQLHSSAFVQVPWRQFVAV